MGSSVVSGPKTPASPRLVASDPAGRGASNCASLTLATHMSGLALSRPRLLAATCLREVGRHTKESVYYVNITSRPFKAVIRPCISTMKDKLVDKAESTGEQKRV